MSGSHPKVNVEQLSEVLLGKWKEARLATREVVSDPFFHTVPGQALDENREATLQRVKTLADRKVPIRAFPEEFGGQNAHAAHLASFSELVLGDPSMQIKMGVQFGLFGGAIQHLGTEEHHKKWLPDVMSLELPGAFAMTEIGHGSDVASIGTIATYDPDTEEFDIHTPFKAAWKDYLGNAALHGQAAVVFAQLITKGVNHGVHAFFVPIRTKDGEMLPGVGSEDDGVKGGLNGIDNGRLHFTHVRVPRTNLLNRYGDVAKDGTYSSPIESPGRRFFTMIGTLVQGRVSLDATAVVAMKAALAIGVTYANQRRQFPKGNGAESLLFDHGLHQRRLLLPLAQTLAMNFASEELLQVFDDVFSGRADTDEKREDLETLAAALKSTSTWAALDTLQEVREACGGAGFIAKNRVTGLRADLDIYATFEGDNNVLMQLVGKRLLTDYAAQFKTGDRSVLVKAALAQFSGKLSRYGLHRVVQGVTDLSVPGRSIEVLQDPEVQRALLADRVQTMVAEIAQALNKGAKASRAEETFNVNQYRLIQAAQAHAELLQWEAFTRALDKFEGDNLTVMTWMRDLFAFSLFEKNAAWFLMNGRLSGDRIEAVSAYIVRLCGRLRHNAQDIVDSFGFTDALLRAEIATGIEEERQKEAAAYKAEHVAAGTWPVEEKALYKKKKEAQRRK